MPYRIIQLLAPFLHWRGQAPNPRAGGSARRSASWGWMLIVATSLASACATAPPAPTPTPVVIVVTATPAPATIAPPTSAPPTPGPPTAAPIAGSPGASTTGGLADGGDQRLTVGRANFYRGLEFTVEEARTGATIENQRAARGKTLVGLRLRVHNPSNQRVQFANDPLTSLLRLQQPNGANPTAENENPFIRPILEPQATIAGWAYWELDRAVPLEPLKLMLGKSSESTAVISLSGPEEVIAPRTFEYLRSTDEVRGLLWSLSGGTLRLDLPGQQANPGQEFIVLKIRATNPSPAEVNLRDTRSVPQDGPGYLRVEADNGVLLQPSAELDALPSRFPPKAEQDSVYAWQLPRGSRNPKLVILSPDGSQARLEIGLLPPP